MMTFSINLGGVTEADSFDVIGATAVNLSDVLYTLKDNENKEITPKDIRSVVLTSQSSSAFKQTIGSSSTTSYVGFDTLNPLDRDVKGTKVYFGKRNYSGTYSYNPSGDIMSNTLLNGDPDFYFFNAKRDTELNFRTRISILTGTSSTLYQNSSYLQSEVVTGFTSSSLSLDLVNPNLNFTTQSSINFTSDYATVSMNNIVYPRKQQSLGLDVGLTAAGDGRVLKWDNGKLIWSDFAYQDTGVIGATGTPLDIYGSTIYVNDEPFEFTDTRPATISFGDISIGESFNKVSISDMLRRILYGYHPPLCGLQILPPYSSGYVEVGTSPVVKLQFTIDKKTNPTTQASLYNMIPGNYPPVTTNYYSTIVGSASGVVITPILPMSTTFSMSVGDGSSTISATTSITGIYPYFYGFSVLSTMTTAGLSDLTKKVEPLEDKTFDITGNGNFYFIYDSTYPNLSGVYDETNTNIIASFSSSLLTLSSPTGLWASKQFKVYQWNNVTQIGPPSENYEFKY